MALERIKFKLTREIDDRLKEVEDQGGSDNDFCIRCIGVAHYVMIKLAGKCSFFQGDDPLPMPQPEQIDIKRRLGHIVLMLDKEDLHDLDEICLNFAIDRLSALAWGIACVDTLNEAIMFAPVSARSKGKIIQLEPGWLK